MLCVQAGEQAGGPRNPDTKYGADTIRYDTSSKHLKYLVNTRMLILNTALGTKYNTKYDTDFSSKGSNT